MNTRRGGEKKQMEIGFHIECKNCHSNSTSIKHIEKFNYYGDDSFAEHWVHLVCEECNNKKLIHSYNTY